nr:response regulator [Desulfogranum mediterraneum]
MNNSILIVEDDRRLGELLAAYLGQQGFTVAVETRGDRAEQRIAESTPDLIILDLMLPGTDGLSVCRRVRPRFRGPILILTAKEEDMDQVAGLEMGADDYVKKPVDPRVLLARIRALLRRTLPEDHDSELVSSQANSSELRFGGLRINRSSRQVELEGDEVALTTAEFDLLWYLARHQGQVLERDRIYSALRGIGYDGTDRSIDVRISQLRKKLGDDPAKPRRIVTIWGAGYQFIKEAW